MSQTIFNFFGLRENPFKINPDPRFLFATDQARATSAELAYAVRTRKGLILLTGEVGTGKTVLLRRLLDWLSEQKMPTALIFNSHIKPDHLLDFILNDFGVPCTSTLKSEKLMALNRWLLERYRAGQTPLLIVDEAQGLDPAALEEIRLLMNLETPREKLLQIVLAGQPELEIKLKRHELRQLRQRITIRCRTSPLTLKQTYGYIRERLRVAGANGNPVFEPEAVGFVHAYSCGIPRVINVLCEHSLISAYADGANVVSPGAVEQAARDCQLDRADSVARILNAGSYSTTGLSDVDSILAAISSGPESPAEPPSRPPPQEARRQVQPPSAAELVNSAPVEKNPPEQNAAPNEIPLAAAAARSYVQEPLPQSQALPASETIPAQTPLAQTHFTRSRPSPPNLLRLWSKSFSSDLRTTSRQLRRAIYSFEIRRWNRFVRSLRQLCTRASREVQASWRSFKSAMPPSLAQYFGTCQQETRNRPKRSASPPARRPRALISLRRWLHGPATTQRKKTEGNQRRSIS